MAKQFKTDDEPGNWQFSQKEHTPGRDAIAILYHAASLREQRKQTAILGRIDERLKRGGFSLAKANRK